MQITLFRDHDVARTRKDVGDDAVSGDPIQHVELKYAGHADKIRSGVWDCAAGVFKADYDGIVEFCHILEGEAVIKSDDGDTVHVKAGDGFILEAGLKAEWTVENYVKKHFVIVQA